jgi:hypothetical protein
MGGKSRKMRGLLQIQPPAGLPLEPVEPVLRKEVSGSALSTLVFAVGWKGRCRKEGWTLRGIETRPLDFGYTQNSPGVSQRGMDPSGD